MRLIDTIPHNLFSIQVFNFNSKYIVKIELDQFEQSFKINQTDINGVDELKAMLDSEFLKNVLNRFIQMRSDWALSYKNIKS